MRISTSLIYNTNVATINRQQADMLHTQQQLSKNTRVVTPSDDPVAAARALEVTQASAHLDVQKTNQGAATDALKTVDSQLSAIYDVLDYVRERTVQAGNSSTLSASDRQSIATDIRSQFDSLLALANGQDSNDNYLFSGYKGDTKAFSGSLANVTYQGDQGTRTLQVSSSRLMPVSVNGDELFMNIASSNGKFTSSTSSMTAVVSAGSEVTSGSYKNDSYRIKFSTATAYDVFDANGATVGSGIYTSGQPISLPDPKDPTIPPAIEATVSISGAPAAGDTFQVTPGNSSDMFSTLKQLVVGLENTSGDGYAGMISDTLDRLDSAMENVLRLRSQNGSQQVEVDALESVGDDLKVQYADRLDRLVGLDYVSAISDFLQQNTYLEAARNTFAKISGLSLFNFLS